MSSITKGTSEYRHAILALFLGSFVTFASLYSIQPLIPTFSEEYSVPPAVASLSVSLTTAALAICMLFAARLSEARGRKPIMIASLVASGVLSILSAFAPNFATLLVIRALQGIALAGYPSIAMAYITEEFDSAHIGMVMGIYISGNSIGGLAGRIVVGALSDLLSWHLALAVLGLISFLASLWFWKGLPDSRHFTPKQATMKQMLPGLLSNLKDPGLLALYGVAFTVMGGFVTLFNYIGYPLMAPPYNLSQTVVGMIFVVYLVGTFSSTWMGQLADKHSKGRVVISGLLIMLLGALVTLTPNLLLKLLGVALFTFGFFGSHSVASSWVGKRALQNKAQASSLYLLFYYVGSSLAGSTGGLFWSHDGWNGVIAMISGLLVLSLLLSSYLTRLKPRTLEKGS